MRNWWGKNEHFYTVYERKREKWESNMAHLVWLSAQYFHVHEAIYLAKKIN